MHVFRNEYLNRKKQEKNAKILKVKFERHQLGSKKFAKYDPNWTNFHERWYSPSGKFVNIAALRRKLNIFCGLF
jgi:hypothetical protein